jgi:hypothetical protein
MSELLQSAAPELRALERLRAEIAGLITDAKAIRSAPLATEEVRERVLRGLQNAVYQYTPENKFTGIQHGNGDEGSLGAMAFGLPDLAWIFGPDALADTIMQRLAASGAKPGLPAAARAARLAEIEDARKRLEVLEELEILKLESKGFQVRHRADADPAILLRVWGTYNQKLAA